MEATHGDLQKTGIRDFLIQIHQGRQAVSALHRPTEQRKADAWATNKQTIIDEAVAEAAAEANHVALDAAAKAAEAKRFDFTRALEYFFKISPDRGGKRASAISSMWNDFTAWAKSQGLLTELAAMDERRRPVHRLSPRLKKPRSSFVSSRMACRCRSSPKSSRSSRPS